MNNAEQQEQRAPTPPSPDGFVWKRAVISRIILGLKFH